MMGKKYDCYNCEDTGYEDYYHDAGDHFSMNASPFSEWRKRPCRKCKRGKANGNAK